MGLVVGGWWLGLAAAHLVLGALQVLEDVVTHEDLGITYGYGCYHNGYSRYHMWLRPLSHMVAYLGLADLHAQARLECEPAGLALFGAAALAVGEQVPYDVRIG